MPNRVLTPVTELDFDGIKQNLKNYLSTTSEFKDFDYEGSGMNILLDVLAYNTHYTAIYANMIAAESFLDSAVLRKSLVSLAKNLGYIPNSINAATATITLELGSTLSSPNIIPTGTNFTATKDGVSYGFTTTKPYSVDKTSIPHKVENMEIRQGSYKSVSFVYDSNSNSTKFEIPSSNIDKDIIQIYVMKSPSDYSNADISWVENTDYLTITPTSKVFFINENYRGNYQISFGDGILGAVPEKGSYIVVMYFETQGLDGNNIGNTDINVSSFSFDGILGNDYDSVVRTISASAGGAARDSEEKIRYTAPKYYQSQDRAVTAFDYESIILREYPAANSVRIWGGENNDPPEYGKVFISILPKNAAILSDAQKNSIIKNILDKKKIVTVNTELVDPEYTYIQLECFATYNSTNSSINEMGIKNAISLTIQRYSNDNLGMFGYPFRYSSLSRQIDLSGNSMLSNRLSLKLLKKILPVPAQGNYTLYFGAALQHPYDGTNSIVTTSEFPHRDSQNIQRTCFIEDDGYGVLAMYSMIGGEKVVINSKIGSIDYATGKVLLNAFNPTGTGTKPYIKFVVTPDQRFDIIPSRNQILVYDPSILDSLIITLQDYAVRKA